MEILEEIQRPKANVCENGRLEGYFCSDTVFNLSNRVLSDSEIKELEKGLDFAPIQRKINEPELRKDFEEFCRRMRIKWNFRNEPSENFSETPVFRLKSSWKPPKGHPNLEVFLSKVEEELFKLVETPLNYSNLTKEEWEAVRSLADDRNIVIKKADKGSSIVIWDRADYLAEANKQLSDNNIYKEVKFREKMLSDLVDTSNKFFKGLKTKGCISEKNLKYFSYEFKKACNLGKLYLLPKIHKRLSDVPGRPVISNCGAPTEKVSEFLDFHLKPIMKNGKSYIRDSNHFLEKIKNISSIPDDAMLVTADVVGLYPSIPHSAGLNSLKRALEKRVNKQIPTSDLVKMAEFVLTNNYFEFSEKVYQQISGTAIGTKFAPPYACIYMDEVETEFLETQNFKPLVWMRYIDDIFFIWTHGEEKLKNFMNEFNNFKSNLKFTFESDSECINFLDLNVKLNNGRLTTSVYIKPTDRHQYLHYRSSHPDHIKRSIVYSQTLRVSRLCSFKEDFLDHSEKMKTWFSKRGYPEKIIETEMKKVKFGENKSKTKSATGVPFVVTYHPRLKALNKIISENLNLLYMNNEVKDTFTPVPMVSFRAARKLSSYLVRAKLYPLERRVGSRKCGKSRCEVCQSVENSDTFQSSITKETFKINHHLNCGSKCLTYLLTCKTCSKQYTGETTDEFRFRWNNYKSNDRKFQRGERCMQEHLFEHFYSEGHNGFLEDVSVTLIDKTDGRDPKKREFYWMRTLKTLAPDGLNIEDCV